MLITPVLKKFSFYPRGNQKLAVSEFFEIYLAAVIFVVLLAGVVVLHYI